MSLNNFFVTEIQIKKQTGKDMYGKPIYVVTNTKAKVEEEFRKIVTTAGEEFVGLTVIYTDTELMPGDLVSVDFVNFYQIIDVSKVRDATGKVIYYKGYCMKGR